ncbi:MAG: enoyl-CoA hydratase-related protein [Chloroflexota bacterium]|nr:enoyl-CoA hydratase-related protein [Chloroflexota bacterium]MDE2683227.1 enoyl-CoA hydratase-related protein [Chloroflexota bacterium]
MRYRKINCEITEFRAAIRLPPSKDGCTIDEDTADELRDYCCELLFADSVRVVTVIGSGGVFATGRLQPPGEIAAAVPDRIDWIARMGAAAAIAKLPMPTIAVLNGDATAHGLELAIAADLRIAAETAQLGMGGLPDCGFPYDGGTQRLPRLVGPGLARDMLLTGRTLSAQEALAAGLVNRIGPAEQLECVAAQLAQQIGSAAPIASRYAKEAVWASGDLTMAQGLRLEADLSVILHSTEDRAEGLRSFTEKRAPQFEGR